jgi:flagellar operon protein
MGGVTMDSINVPSASMMRPPEITDFLQAPSIGMRPQAKNGKEFSEVLEQAMLPNDVEVNFSEQAKECFEHRGISMDVEDITRLDEAMDEAEENGAHNSLIVMDGTAYVVNIENRTVVSTMNAPNTDTSVFTQIDSAVIA